MSQVDLGMAQRVLLGWTCVQLVVPNPPVGQLEALVWGDVAEVCEEVVEGVSGEVQCSAGLMRVEQPHDVHAKVPLQPLHVGVGTVKHLRAAGKQHRGETSAVRCHRTTSTQTHYMCVCVWKKFEKVSFFLNLDYFWDLSVVETHAANPSTGFPGCVSHSRFHTHHRTPTSRVSVWFKPSQTFVLLQYSIVCEVKAPNLETRLTE